MADRRLTFCLFSLLPISAQLLEAAVLINLGAFQLVQSCVSDVCVTIRRVSDGYFSYHNPADPGLSSQPRTPLPPENAVGLGYGSPLSMPASPPEDSMGVLLQSGLYMRAAAEEYLAGTFGGSLGTSTASAAHGQGSASVSRRGSLRSRTPPVSYADALGHTNNTSSSKRRSVSRGHSVDAEEQQWSEEDRAGARTGGGGRRNHRSQPQSPTPSLNSLRGPVVCETETDMMMGVDVDDTFAYALGSADIRVVAPQGRGSRSGSCSPLAAASYADVRIGGAPSPCPYTTTTTAASAGIPCHHRETTPPHSTLSPSPSPSPSPSVSPAPQLEVLYHHHSSKGGEKVAQMQLNNNSNSCTTTTGADMGSSGNGNGAPRRQHHVYGRNATLEPAVEGRKRSISVG